MRSIVVAATLLPIAACTGDGNGTWTLRATLDLAQGSPPVIYEDLAGAESTVIVTGFSDVMNRSVEDGWVFWQIREPTFAVSGGSGDLHSAIEDAWNEQASVEFSMVLVGGDPYFHAGMILGEHHRLALGRASSAVPIDVALDEDGLPTLGPFDSACDVSLTWWDDSDVMIDGLYTTGGGKIAYR
jgi:hypothetical protein